MRAVICEAFGPVEMLKVAETDDPVPPPGHVVVDVKAAGLNFPDVLCVQGLYQFRPDPPFTPGQEGAGVVSAVGEGVSGVKLGDRVGFVVLSGAFAEKACVPAGALIPLPDAIDFDVAAGFSMIYGTSYYALKQRGRLEAGQTLLVLGAGGGVGRAAVELGAVMGARVFAAASSPEKRAAALEAGADETIDYVNEDLKERVKALTGGKGVDVVYDPVGGDYAEPALRAIGWDGRYLVVGFAAGDIPKIPLNLPLLKGCQIVGVFWGAFTVRDPKTHAANMAELFALYEKGALKPHLSARHPLVDIREGLNALADRRAVGKIIVTM